MDSDVWWPSFVAESLSQNVNLHSLDDYNERKESYFRTSSIKNKTETIIYVSSGCAPMNRITAARQLHVVKELRLQGLHYDMINTRTFDKFVQNFEIENYKFMLFYDYGDTINFEAKTLFNYALYKGVVPVVIGSNYNNYKRIAPPDSFIHSNQFPTLEGLLQYIKNIEENSLDYFKHLQWKTVNEKSATIDLTSIGFCKLCQVLHQSIIETASSQFKLTTRHLRDSWYADECVFQSDTYMNSQFTMLFTTIVFVLSLSLFSYFYYFNDKVYIYSRSNVLFNVS